MEKQDVNRAARTIRSLMRERRYKEVIKIARSLKLDRVNNGLLVLDIVEAYEHLSEKKEAKNTLMNYYDVHGITGRNMMQKLIELCIETGDINNAVGLCMEFENEWPESSISYLMRYQITTSAGGGLEERIYYLEKYKEAEFEERWGYELAKLYHKNDQQEECAAVCHELICFFGHGKYVEKAVQLKEKTTGLSEDEISILDAVKRREEEARIRREEEARLAREEAERLAREEEERLAREEEERLAREEAERLAREEEARLAQEEAERLAQKETERLSAAEEAARRNAWSQGQKRQQATWENAGNSEEEESIAAAARKAREAEQEKIRQTEEAARLLREKREEEKNAREQKIAQAFKTSDRYAQVEKNKAEGIYFQDLSVNEEKTETKQKKKQSQQSSSIFSSFGRMASDFRKTLQPDDEYLEDTSEEIEYITIGRDSQAYAEDVEERMLSELDMLDDEELDSLTSEQIKEIYELKILHDVRENIRKLIVDTDSSYKTGRSAQELERFVQSDPYPNPINKNDQAAELGENIRHSERDEQEEAAEVIEAEDENKIISKEPATNIEDTSEIVEKTEVEETEKSIIETETNFKKTDETTADEKEEVETAGEITVEAEKEADIAEEMPVEAEEETDTAGEEIVETEEETKASGEETVEIEKEADATEEAPVEAEEETDTAGEAIAEAEEEADTAEEVPVEAEKETEAAGETIAEAETKPEKTGEAAVEAKAECTEEAVPEEEKTIQGPEKNKVNGLPESIFKLKKMIETAESAAEKAVETVTGNKVKTSLEETTETIEAEHVESAAETGISKESSEDSNAKEQQKVKTTILDKIENADENLAVTEFIECITAYAATKGYEVDEMAYMTIAVLAEEMQQQKAPLSLNNARKMADEAIARVQKRNPLDKIMDRYSKKRAYILKDKHFYWNPQKG